MLSDNDRATVRAEVGDDPDDETLDEIYGRVGTVGGVIYEVLTRRLADYMANPAQFAVPGKYSQNVQANIQALQAQVARWSAFAPSTTAPLSTMRLKSRHVR